MDQGDWILIWFLVIQPEQIGAIQTISQKLAEASGNTHSTFFEDIVSKLYQEFSDGFVKESFYKLPDQNQYDHAIELVLDSQNLSTKVYP